MLCYVVLCYGTLYDVVSFILCCTVLCYVIWCLAKVRYFVLFFVWCIILYYIMLYFTISYHIVSYQGALHHAIGSYMVSCCMLYDICNMLLCYMLHDI